MKRLSAKLPYLTRILLSVSILIPIGAWSQIKVIRVENQDELAGKNGIVYSLPRTVVVAELRITKSQQFTGPLATYASEYLGIDEVITKDAVSYSIESAVIRTVTEPDPEQVYLIQKEDKSPGEIWVSFGKQQPILTMETFDKAKASVPEGFSSWNKDLFQTSESARLFKKYTDSPTREITDTIIRKVSIDTLVIEETLFRHSREEYSDPEKAGEAADKIREIEHDKYNLLIGYPETAYSKEAMEYMVGELEKQRQDYLKLFTGVTIKESIVFSLPVIPDAENENQDYVIGGFSKTAGITEATEQNSIAMTFKSDGEPVKANQESGLPGAGLVYLLPRTFQVVLAFQGKELTARRVEVLQLGTLLSLPSTFKKIEFNLETGGLQSVVIE